MNNYYKEQIEKINPSAKTVSVKITDFDGNATHTLSLKNHDGQKAVRSLMAKLDDRTPQFHSIEVKYLPCTNSRGSRVQLKCYDMKHLNGEKPKSKILSYDHSFNSSDDIALNALKKAGLDVIGFNGRGPVTVIFCEWDFDKLYAFFNVKQ